ncbi:unnamed protein product [Calicophoron daubneyi]|uniref:Uncharacterized protein n=1 Tax=Calicophoron daubneyi TaxID=300641 RepID=A0AAV2T7U0_CALDB
MACCKSDRRRTVLKKMRLEFRHLSIILLGLAIILIILGLATPSWRCGSLFTSCQHYADSAAVIVVITTLLIALFCLIAVFIIDIMDLCSYAPAHQSPVLLARYVLVFIGLGLLLVGLFVYTGKVGWDWSYLAVTVGIVFVFQVTIMALVTCRCTRSGNQLTVETSWH